MKEIYISIIGIILSTWSLCHPQNLYHKIRGTETAQFEKIITAKPNTRIVIQQRNNGNITIHGSKQNEIKINESQTGKKGSIASANSLIEQRDNDLIISIPEGANSISLDIQVPEKTELHITSANGSITIEDIKKSMFLSTGSGNITLNNAQESIQAQTNNGTIEIVFESVLPGSSITLEATANIILTMPQGTSGELLANTQGRIISEHFITLNPITTKIHARTWKELLKSINGYIGASSPRKINHKGPATRFILTSTRGGKIYIQ